MEEDKIAGIINKHIRCTHSKEAIMRLELFAEDLSNYFNEEWKKSNQSFDTKTFLKDCGVK